MNFQNVKAAMGEKDPQNPQYDAKVEMYATFNEIGGITFTTNQKQTCAVKLIDDQGEGHKVHLYGSDLPDASWLNKRCLFAISAYQGTGRNGSYTGYQGFWRNANVRQNAPQTPPSPPPQGLLNQPQVTNTANGTNNTKEEEARIRYEEQKKVERESIEKQVIIKAVCEVAARRNMDLGIAVQWCCTLHKWIQDGKDVPTMANSQVTYGAGVTDDDIPF